MGNDTVGVIYEKYSVIRCTSPLEGASTTLLRDGLRLMAAAQYGWNTLPSSEAGNIITIVADNRAAGDRNDRLDR